MAEPAPKLPDGKGRVLVLGLGPLTLVMLLLWATGELDLLHAVLLGAVALAGGVAVKRYYRREMETFARYAETLVEEGGRDVAAPTAEAELASAIARLHQRILSERERMAGQASAADAMLEALPDPVVLLDADRRVVRANAAARDLFGAGLVGEDLTFTVRHPAVVEAVSAVLAGQTAARAFEFQLPLNPPQDYSARAVALPRDTGGPVTVVLTLHDLTALKRAEQMRVDFVANASHELRTPLATLVGFIETLQGPARDDAAARERFLQIMSDQAGRMARLIRDLLSLSQIELNEHTPPRERVDVTQVVRSVLNMMEVEAQARGVAIASDIEGDLPAVIGDADELTQILQNLVDNAIKYGGQGKEVRIAVRRAVLSSRGQTAVALAVRDQGPGIAREHLPRLTERFYRVDTARSRSLGGTGLGLAIVKHIVNRHRGALTIDSQPGEGSTFTVFLPAEEAPPARRAA